MSSRLRVAMVQYRDDAAAGGSLRVGETLVRHLDPERFDARMLFVYGEPGPVAAAGRVPVDYLRCEGPLHPGSWRRFRREVRHAGYDVLHFQDAILWAMLASVRSGAARVLHVHGRFFPAAAGRRNLALNRIAGRSADAQICISRGAREAQLAHRLARPDRAHVVYNAIDVPYFRDLPDRDSARRVFGLPPGALLLGMVCRLVWPKGCEDLLRILERLPARWHGVLAGEGPDRSRLERLAAERGVAGRLHFLGTCGDVRPVYASIDALAFLTRYEPFGLVLVEAMAAGVPVFALGAAGE